MAKDAHKTIKKGNDMQCIQCKKEFESKRSTAKYCSDKCRKLAFQGISQSGEVSVPESPFEGLSVPEVEVSVPCTNDNTTDACKYLGANIYKDRDHHQSINYAISEECFKRRNKAWDSISEKFKVDIIEGAKRRLHERQEQVKAVIARREAAHYVSE